VIFERVGFGRTLEPRCVEEDELEFTPGGRRGHRRHLPPERVERCVGQQRGEEGAEAVVLLPQVDDVAVADRATVAAQSVLAHTTARCGLDGGLPHD
jgi:hypothetical protein